VIDTMDSPELARQHVRMATAMRDLDRTIDHAFAQYRVLERRLAALDKDAAAVQSRLQAAGFLVRREDLDQPTATTGQATRRRVRTGRPKPAGQSASRSVRVLKTPAMDDVHSRMAFQ
jgi:hypothetical protein